MNTTEINNQDSQEKNGGQTVGKIAANDYRKAEVFMKLGIDFCCKGNQTLEQACKQANISEAELRSTLDLVSFSRPDPSMDFSTREPDFLIDYIIDIHHKYVKDNIPVIRNYAQKVAGHHGKAHPELSELEKQIGPFLKDLSTHMLKEEKILFPAIKELVALQRQPGASGRPVLPFIRQAVGMMQSEHEQSGEDLSLLRKITNNYILPEGACNSYKFLFEKLKEFETDLFRHIHLENNILFPKAIALLEGFPLSSN